LEIASPWPPVNFRLSVNSSMLLFLVT